jgi:hypothetical protein
VRRGGGDARIVLAAGEGANNTAIAHRLGIEANTARLWRGRWLGLGALSLAELSVAERLEDAPRPGGPGRPADQPVERARARGRGGQAGDRGPALAAPRRAVAQKGGPQPHRSRYWLTPAAEPEAEAKIADVCARYQAAPALAAGERVVSTDELTGGPALERNHPGLPLAPGRVERREFEYIRHSTTTVILNRNVVSGQALAPSHGPTRTEADFVATSGRPSPPIPRPAAGTSASTT